MKKLFLVIAFSVILILAGCSQNAEVQPEEETWLCVCGAENTGNFCSSCGKAKNSESESEVSEESEEKSEEEPVVFKPSEDNYIFEYLKGRWSENSSATKSIEYDEVKTGDDVLHMYYHKVYVGNDPLRLVDEATWKSYTATMNDFCTLVQDEIKEFDENAVYILILVDSKDEKDIFASMGGLTAFDAGADYYGY